MEDKRVSKLAKIAFVAPVMLWGIGLVLLRLAAPLSEPLPSSGLEGYFADLGMDFLVSVLPVSLFLGILAIRQIKIQPDKLSGTKWAVRGMLLGIFLEAVTLYVFMELRFASGG